jgi:hypothetical protein
LYRVVFIWNFSRPVLTAATLALERYPGQGECGSQAAAANKNLSSGKLRPENAKARHVLAFIFLFRQIARKKSPLESPDR